MKYIITVLFALLISVSSLFAQEKEVYYATDYGVLPEPIYVPSLASQIENGTFIGVDENAPMKEGHPKRRWGNNVIPGKGNPNVDDALVEDQRKAAKKKSKEPLLIFEANSANATPSDPTGAVGPNHFIGAWNSGFRIFDKEGNPLTNEASLSTLFPGNNLGDPIVLYDVEADRFIITEFDSSPNGLNVAVCQGPDPVNDGWHIYTTGFTTGQFPDYPKFSIWSDGYYVTANIGGSNKVFVLDRTEMLQGNSSQFVRLPLPGLATSGFFSPQFFNVTNGDLPPVGNAYVVYLQDDAWGGVSEDHLKIWTVNVDWDNIDNSNISSAFQIPTTPFVSVFDGGSFSNVPQPSGPNQDVLQATIMNQAQYRRFPTYNSVIFNFVIDIDGPGELAGIRWYELRQSDDGEDWEIYQEGTYVSPYDDKHAFSGSMAMDGQGNIGMAYTTCSNTEMISIFYTGRYANDPLGQMTVDETFIAESTGNNPSNRLADYVHLTLDPENDKTFWHIAEYFNTSRKDIVAAFQIAPDFQNDIGLAEIVNPVDGELSSTEEITISIYNSGEFEQSNFPVNYQIDGGEIVTETFSGTIDPQAYESYTFSQTADLGVIGQTYEIKAFTSLDGDEYMYNDSLVKVVKYFGPTDLGVTLMNQPVSGEDLGSDEEVIVTVENFGTDSQSNFDVSFEIEGITTTETVDGPIAFGESTTYTFDETVDVSEPGIHYFKAFTSLTGDVDHNNDTTYRTVLNTDCIPEASCANGHEIKRVILGSIDNESACSENAYGDYLDHMTDLDVNSINDLSIGASYGNQFVKVWIDFNDDFVFGENEVVSAFEIADGQSAGDFLQTDVLTVPETAMLGEHLMRVKLSWIIPIEDGGACDPIIQGGETEDYMVNIVQPVGLADLALTDADYRIADLGNNQFKVIMTTKEWNEPLRIDVHNTMGQCVLHNRVAKNGNTYTYDLDMSYAQKGMYIVRFGSDEYGKVKKILVK